jgi:hypothetical protein
MHNLGSVLSTGIIGFCVFLVSCLFAVSKIGRHSDVCNPVHRALMNSIFHAFWQGANGASQGVRGRAIDITDRGMILKTSKPVRSDSQVFLECPRYHLTVTARVRTCMRKGLSYNVGLEFTSRLTVHAS